ncbi:hypothetical protein Patl1_17955 [Pistacia atlantica]|uniref:Uncharacterized protein n=1 Tax=Pistacia atlantica TaxID=434234 RepID=A0ACC1BYA6_9ROSI|nr:hypothetical protein Patl1_17955 [Pistacia atlantica]
MSAMFPRLQRLSELGSSRHPLIVWGTTLSNNVSFPHSFEVAPVIYTGRTMAGNRWLRPEVYPLFAAVGAAVGICAFQLVRNICINPEVRCLSHFGFIFYAVTKENRAAGILENFDEGEKYSQHFVRKYVRGRAPEIMPSINSFFTDPK